MGLANEAKWPAVTPLRLDSALAARLLSAERAFTAKLGARLPRQAFIAMLLTRGLGELEREQGAKRPAKRPRRGKA